MNVTECSGGSTRRSCLVLDQADIRKCLSGGQLWLGVSTGPEPKTRLQPEDGSDLLSTSRQLTIPDFKITRIIALLPEGTAADASYLITVHNHVGSCQNCGPFLGP